MDEDDMMEMMMQGNSPFSDLLRIAAHIEDTENDFVRTGLSEVFDALVGTLTRQLTPVETVVRNVNFEVIPGGKNSTH